MREEQLELELHAVAEANTRKRHHGNGRHSGSWWLVGVVVASIVLTLLPPPELKTFAFAEPPRIEHLHGPNESVLAWLSRLRFALAFVVSVPFILAYAAAKEATTHSAWKASNYELNVAPRLHDLAVSSKEDGRDHLRWIQTKNASQATWSYELFRFKRSLERVRMNALLFGSVSTFILAVCVFALALSHAFPSQTKLLPNLIASLIVATSSCFLMRLGGIAVRISSVDISARMFAWATRSIILAAIADLGLFFTVEKLGATWNQLNLEHAVLLGVFSAATGDHALDLLLRRAAKLFGAAAPSEAGASELLKLEGVTAKHVDRLEEEDILSIHDLAFVPTARLFFSTAYSLQQICNWQDRALLWVYVGAEGATSLGRQMKIMGAIDLLDCAHQVLHESNPDKEDVRKTLSTALTLDKGGLYALLRSMAHDQVTRRVRLYWQGAVATTPSPTDDEAGAQDTLSTADCNRGAAANGVIVAEEFTLIRQGTRGDG
ncbi:MAG TPA: hypothetical protein VFK05_33535 [Polyangiaceae bacterium]|nr:hypothetical protein [Polyangiaceae bacterium]